MKSMQERPIWKNLENHYHAHHHFDMRQAFAEDPHRFEQFSLSAAGLFLDFSKNRINQQTRSLLIAHAKEAGLKAKIEAMFQGKILNVTEQRPGLHVALRQRHQTPLIVNGQD